VLQRLLCYNRLL